MNALRMGLSVWILVACRVYGHYEFPERHALTVQLGGSGAGSVTSEPPGLTCSAGACSGEFFEGTEVRLSASATAGSFLGWTEACRGRGECTITMDRDQALGALFGTPGEALWARQLGSEESDYGKAIAIDSNNNLIAVGAFSGTITAGSELTSNGGLDIYVVKLASSTGTVIWAKGFGGTLSDLGINYYDDVFGVTVDRSKNIYVTGIFAGTVDFGGGPLTVPVGEQAIFVLKLDADGSFGWARKIEGFGFGAPGGLAGGRGSIATNGDAVVVAGKFSSMTVDGTTLMSVASPDAYALKLSASTGATVWVKSFGGAGFDVASGVTLEQNGNVVLTGNFEGTVDFGGGPLSSAQGSGFLLKLADANGAHLLSKQLGSPSASCNAIAVDSANNIIITGWFLDTADFGCTNRLTASQAGVGDIYLVKYTQAGSCIWAKGFGGPVAMSTNRNVTSIGVNSSGEVSIAGAFSGSISFGGETLLSASFGRDVFAARFAGDGIHLSSIRAGGTSNDYGFGIAQSSDGRAFVTGQFEGFAEFGSGAFTSIGGEDAFIVGFAPL
jgi:hypothetical protein